MSRRLISHELFTVKKHNSKLNRSEELNLPTCFIRQVHNRKRKKNDSKIRSDVIINIIIDRPQLLVHACVIFLNYGSVEEIYFASVN